MINDKLQYFEKALLYFIYHRLFSYIYMLELSHGARYVKDSFGLWYSGSVVINTEIGFIMIRLQGNDNIFFILHGFNNLLEIIL